MSNRALPWRIALFFVVSIYTVAAYSPRSTFADNAGSKPVAPGGPTLKVTLQKGLIARRPVEFAFIDKVIQKVDNGELPKKMVERTFLWARDNKQPFPMPYFMEALRLQAKKIHVEL